MWRIALLSLAGAMPGFAVTLFDGDSTGEWRSDGMWKIEPRNGGIGFYKNETPAHNSMCWTTLAEPLKNGDVIAITFRMEKPF